ncbi:type II secretion system protein GspE [candidate division GN15 bacterium]|nr:type II secretion system protein GspE [candidate division GN15 bacterium]
MSKRIGDILIDRGLITNEQIQQALAVQRESNMKLGEVLVDEGFITSDELVDAISERLNVPKITLDNVFVDPDVLSILPLELVKRHQLLPVFKIGDTLTVAMADPLDFIAVDEVRYLTKLKINRVVATRETILHAVEEHYSVKDSLEDALSDIAKQQQTDLRSTASGALGDDIVAGEAPVIKYVNLLITQALKDRSSDIHVEPEEDTVRLRYRVNGILQEEGTPPKSVQSALISRLKIMAGMDVSEQRVPQDGRFTFATGQGPVDVRVSTLPTIHGEKIVLRLLDRRNLLLGIDKLGFDPATEQRFRNILSKPEGLILISGPTGSGKTSTLYAMLDELNSPEKNIITVEDPVEYNLPHINQVQTNEKVELTFASCLRAILRQNPDVIMVGEIRDSETAQMAVRSAMTGHLVLSTIHTNDAAGAVSRLLDMEVESFLLGSALLGVVAQRLVRAVCPSCSVDDPPPQEVMARLQLPAGAPTTFVRGEGCPKCGDTGFKGRSGVFEFLMIDDAVQRLILSQSPASEIKRHAVAHGMKTLHQHALEKALNGETTYREVLRVTQRAESDEATTKNAQSVHI